MYNMCLKMLGLGGENEDSILKLYSINDIITFMRKTDENQDVNVN